MAYISDLDRHVGDDLSHIRDELSSQLELAAPRIESDPDDASLMLDGLIWRLGAALSLARSGALASRERLLVQLDENDPILARRLRLALRAPDARARLVHAQQQYSLVLESESQIECILARLEAV
ncbi:MAG TPA: hypothetical protein VGP82_14130 [Ktedonobacterales bacterium]|nr:hypothetical protein [Ktedonobacterales bacterium]